ALYDLCIPFLLLLRRTRILAMMGVVFFHVMTWVLFNIGMFPWIMIVSSTIFLSPQWYEDRFADLQRLFPRLQRSSTHDTSVARSARPQRRIPLVLPIFFAIQLLLPWRYLLYPGELFWTEEGFRFSWRVMLMEKAGYANFKIVDGETGKRMYVDNDDFLTSFQEKQMSTQADFILEYAHYLGHQYEAKGVKNPEVYVENYVALNGRPSRLFVDPEVNLMEINPSLATRTWILEFDDEIHGL
ncbi:MAG: HTTM domain-containing protein, partial [Bacteroidota bacterium]